MMTIDRMRHRLARIINWFKVTKGGDTVASPPPLAVVRDMLACPDAPLPILTASLKPRFLPRMVPCKPSLDTVRQA
jgi:hypothetical protein